MNKISAKVWSEKAKETMTKFNTDNEFRIKFLEEQVVEDTFWLNKAIEQGYTEAINIANKFLSSSKEGLKYYKNGGKTLFEIINESGE